VRIGSKCNVGDSTSADNVVIGVHEYASLSGARGKSSTVMWLIRQIMAIWLTLLAICAGTVVIARANPGPNRLQALGFAVCDGEPCYRGIKPGMAWDKAKALYPDGLVERERMISFAGEQSPFRMINFQRSEEQTVRRIEFVRRSPQLIPASLGEVVALFGIPCHMEVGYSRIGNNAVIWTQMYYPTFYTSVRLENTGRSSDPRLRPETFLSSFGMIDRKNFDGCIAGDRNNPVVLGSGGWKGFVSREVYMARVQRSNRAMP
jgi:hypothetical protein